MRLVGTNLNDLLFKEVDAALGPFVVTLQRYEQIGIGGLFGSVHSAMLIRYPSETVTSIYATLEPYNYTVINNS